MLIFSILARPNPMWVLRSMLLVSLVVLTACSQLSKLPADAPDSLRVATLRTMIDRVLTRRIESDGPGLAMIVRQKGKVVYQGNVGTANRLNHEPITVKTAFELASAAKPLTAASVLSLVEADIVHLEDSILKWLPGLPHEWSEITVRDLLTHQSGIPDYMAEVNLKDIKKLDGLTNAMLLEHWRASQALLFLPGTRSEYSNSNYVLLAEIIASATKKSFSEQMAASVFNPLGMQASYVDGSPPKGDINLALNYGSTELTNGIHLGTQGPTGIYSSAEDISIWLAALSEGHILSPTMFQQMTSPQSNGPTFNDGERYGYGWALPAVGDPRDTFVHAGKKDGYRSVIHVNRGRKVDYVILSNGGDALMPALNEIRYLIQTLLEDGEGR